MLRDGVSSYIGEEISRHYMEDLPKKWERFDDVAILPRGSFEGEMWGDFRNEGFWKVVAEALGASRLALAGEVRGDFRQSGVELLIGEDDQVVRRENGIDYHYRLTKCMFSAGNVNERRRMASQTEEGETVLDLYAGIGYYSLPILVHSKAAHVHACEWNPHALESLRVNLEANGVIERCTIHGGDNRLSNEDICGLADRVLLGLLPSSEEGYKAALDAIKPSGGVLHVHGLGRTRNHEAWADDVESSLLRISNSIGLERSSLVKVKSHSPHWDHLVLDVFIQPA